MTYFGVSIINTNSGKFGVVLREALTETLNWRHTYNDFEDALITAKIWARSYGCEVEDKTTHH